MAKPKQSGFALRPGKRPFLPMGANLNPLFIKNNMKNSTFEDCVFACHPEHVPMSIEVGAGRGT